MKKCALILAVLLIVGAFTATAQDVNDDFTSMRNWTPAEGDWIVRGGRLVQQDTEAAMARIDRMADQSGQYELEFTIRYVDGGYESVEDLRNGEIHGGFGIHLGVEDPLLGKRSWGNGESYLLWLNVDFRPETRERLPQHYGFRAQVYESKGPTSMDLARSPLITEDPVLRRFAYQDFVSLDILAALDYWGIDVNLRDFEKFLYRDSPINIKVNARTGQIGVKDPTAPLRFYFPVDPRILRGDYVSLRTNGLAVSYDSFTVK